MKIVLSYNETDSYLQRSKVLWKNASQRQFRASLFFLIFGVFLLLTGFNNPVYSKSDLIAESSVYNLKLSISFGISITFLSLAFFYALHQNKKKFQDAISARIKRAAAIGNKVTTIAITNVSITISDFETIVETKWSAFSFYKIDNGYVLLYMFQYAPNYVVELGKMSAEDKLTFETFLKENLQLRK